MKLTVTTEHVVTFTICEYEQTEGGMNYSEFNTNLDSLESAIASLEIARRTRPQEDWIIQCNVKTSVKGVKA